MKKTSTLLIFVAALVLGAGGALSQPAGMMDGYGDGMDQGMMGDSGPGMGQGTMGGPGPGMGQGMMGGAGPGMGQGMMGGAGPGMGQGMMGGGGFMGQRGMMGMMHGCGMMGMHGRAASYVEGRIAFLRAELGITDAQKAAWDTYAEAVRNHLRTIKELPEKMQAVFEARTPVERLDARIAAIESRLNSLKELKPALTKLYDALNPDQKKKADDLLTRIGCMK